MMAFAHFELIPFQTGMAAPLVHARLDEVFRLAGLSDVTHHGNEADFSGEVASVMHKANRLRRALTVCGAEHEFSALVRLELAHQSKLRRVS